MPRLSTLALLLVLVSSGYCAAQDLVAKTEPLTPAEQQKKFKLPPGFEIQLVACEPDVHKPMNLKFDARGRLWITHSLEYPFAAKEGAKARDSITVFSELGEDGRAKKVQNFATGLNIPIGVLPLDDQSTIAWAIPNLYRFTDTNGDGVADEKKIAYGPFGFTDTHGNQNGLTCWLNGWVYACHGFNNQSQVKLGGEGEVVMSLQSGNTYRFRADGSRIEQISWGQVNPFGLCFDPLGNMFTADCHSKPVTMILREGYYQSFGKPHDGLGYAPEATNTDHGGTGISGVVYYDADQFPAEYRNVLFVGNVITNQIHCDRLKWNGSTPWVDKVEKFVSCDDPWFRPVDVQLGPDGALYVLDFYNKIIGHYEVPLTHPERDRERGRVWRIVYKGDAAKAKLTPMPDLREAKAEKLAELLGDKNLTVRVLATNTLLDRFPKEAEKLAREIIAKSQNDAQRAHAVWVVARTSGIDPKIGNTLMGDASRLVRTHAVQALAEAEKWGEWEYDAAQCRVGDIDPFVQRAAVQALARHPHAENIHVLCNVRSRAPANDNDLTHAAKIALRNQLRSPAVAEKLPGLKLEKEDYRQVLEIAALSPQGPGATLIYEAALRGDVDDALLSKALPAAARYIDVAKSEELIDFCAKRFKDDVASRLAVLRGMHEGLAQRGAKPPEKLKSELVTAIRASLAGAKENLWVNEPVAGAKPSASPWVMEKRAYSDGALEISVISSLHSPGAGERMTGVLKSPAFKLPKQLSFFMCGHNGLPTTKDVQKNYIRLVLEDGVEVARSYPPRNDIAQPFKWDLAAHEGKLGRIEVVDNFVADGYAWIAVSRFDPPVVRIPAGAVGDPDASRAELFRVAGQLKLAALSSDIATAAKNAEQSPAVRLSACDALVAIDAEQAVTPLGAIVSDARLAAAARQQAADLLGRIDRDDARQLLVAQFKTAPQSLQVALAAALAGKASAPALLKEIRAGRASAALLKEPTVLAKLKTAEVGKLDEQIAELTAKLSPADDRIAALIKTRRDKFLAGKFDPAAGKALFAKSACAQCHKIGETGSAIAPALDGIGVRGLDRLLEDLLDPNRNVDLAFRVHAITTNDGQVLSGFSPREEGKTLVLNDNQGQPLRVQLDNIDSRTIIPLSPMPANLADQVKEEEFYPLVAYLLSLQAK